MKIAIPYGRSSMEIDVPDDRLLAVLRPAEPEGAPEDFVLQRAIVERALANPVASPPLRRLASGRSRATVITSDHTRPVPSRITLPPLLEEMRAENASLEVTLLVATGMHRPTTADELGERLGSSILSRERVVVHDARCDDDLRFLGKLPSGGDLWVNRFAVETDLLVAEGFIEPHFFAGFSGGRKSVLPGVAGYRTVLANHCASFIASPRARTGSLDGNPIHADMLFAAEAARLAFILNVALDGKKRIRAAWAGHPDGAHRRGCAEVARSAAVDGRRKAPIVVTSNGGYPLDQNVYQAVKGMTAAEALCSDGGVIIAIAACEDGHGGQAFFDALAGAASPRELLESVEGRAMEETEPDQWEYQILARILNRVKVIVVSDRCPPELFEAIHLRWAPTFERALAMADEGTGPDADIIVVPDGVAVVVETVGEASR